MTTTSSVGHALTTTGSDERVSVLAHRVRIGWGMALLAAPGVVLSAAGAQNDRPARLVLRVLGLRHVAQALVCGPRPNATVARWAAGIDATHAVSALGLAAVDRSRRRLALADTVLASAWAVLDLRRTRHPSLRTVGATGAGDQQEEAGS